RVHGVPVEGFGDGLKVERLHSLPPDSSSELGKILAVEGRHVRNQPGEAGCVLRFHCSAPSSSAASRSATARLLASRASWRFGALRSPFRRWQHAFRYSRASAGCSVTAAATASLTIGK